jgi:dihydrofolate synthase/folylpolyglutamate synthase
MIYTECLSYLQRLGNEVLTMKFGLETIRKLCQELGGVHLAFPAVVVAGTNGKGSTARFVAAAATAGGLRTGLFTSPHLVRVTERIRVNGAEIVPEDFADSFSAVAERVAAGALPAHPTFFEMLTATALVHFARAQVDLAVLEVGMGGRLDSTNVVEPVVSVLTPIGLDHQQYLGATIPLIAREKAGILRRGVPAWSAPQVPEAAAVLETVAGELGTVLHFVTGGEAREIHEEDGRCRFCLDGIAYRLATPGRFQLNNAVLAARAVRELERIGLRVDPEAAATGMGSVQVPGVLQVLEGAPRIYVDGAHNPDAASRLADFVSAWVGRPRHLLFGIMADKDIGGVLGLLAPLFDRVVLTRVRSPRAADPGLIRQRWCPRAEVREDSLAALEHARQDAAAVVVAGSFYLAGEILAAVAPAETGLRS